MIGEIEREGEKNKNNNIFKLLINKYGKIYAYLVK